MQLRTRRAKRALAARGMVEAVTLVVHLQAGGGIVRRRGERTGARQSDCVRFVRHAAEPVARTDRGHAGQWRPRFFGCRAVRGRTNLQGRPSGGSVRGGLRRSSRLCILEGIGPALVRLGAGRRVRCEGRRVCRARSRRRADAGAADRTRRPELAAPGTVPARSRSGRRTSSAILAKCIHARWKRCAPTVP